MYGVEEFIAPREALLSGGAFQGVGDGGRTDVYGDVAHWFGTYAKQGVMDGEPFTGRG